VRGLLIAALAGTPHLQGTLETMHQAVEASSAESGGLVAEGHGEVLGVVLYGEVAGAVGAAKLCALTVAEGARGQGVGRALLQRTRAVLAAAYAARIVVVELADHPTLAAGCRFLEAMGFREEARIADFYRDGVALLLLRLDLGTAEG
jgi:ribosomal protein S18 acetylase RimI-like enzyme